MPDREGRKKILSAILSRSSLLENSIDNLDMGSISSETEGYVGADLVMLTERATHCAMMRVIEEFGMEKQKEQDLSNLVQINQQDFDNAIKNFVPTSLRGAKLQKSGVLWNDIGGLSDVRQILIETLEVKKFFILFIFYFFFLKKKLKSFCFISTLFSGQGNMVHFLNHVH